VTDSAPIAIFDSGIGGLTVLAALQARLPRERFVYLGDTARLPYGTKSTETVTRYTLRAAQVLSSFAPKLLVVACNTASAAALPELERSLAVPVLGVIEPGARTAVRATRGRVGVIGTESTIASGAYPRALRALRPSLEILLQPCPLFVPLAEEGWFDHPVTREVARIYLEPLVSAGIDTLVLGCTHYPLLATAIRAVVGEGVTLVDSAQAVAEDVAVQVGSPAGAGGGEGSARILVTDAAPRFLRLARFILGDRVASLEAVDLPA
jgi:glutamate racemase